MSKTIRFVTLYPRGSAVELYKDVGQIPYTLGLREDVESKLICCYATPEEVKQKGPKGLHYGQISMLFHNQTLTGLVYILGNARKVDWFNFYHGGRHTYYWSKLYKLLNPEGKVYLKLDLSYLGCKKYSGDKKELKIFEKSIGIADIVSVESEKIKELTQQFTKQNLEVFENGYIEVPHTHSDTMPKREKCFITVGRLGTYEKATDILLEAFARSAAMHDWTLKLVGSVAPEFAGQKEAFFDKYPDLTKRVIFTGPIYDREKLYEEYASARVFVLPSRYEASPLVGPEALRCGLRMILSDSIPPIKELTNDLKFGTVIKADDVEALKDALVKETRRPYSDTEAEEIAQYARRKLSWTSICDRLYQLLINKSCQRMEK